MRTRPTAWALLLYAVLVHSADVQYATLETDYVPNPDRGLYRMYTTRSSSFTALSSASTDLKNYRDSEGLRLVLRLYYLDSFKSSNISSQFLDLVAADFVTLNNLGMKAILRFAYTDVKTAPYGDSSKSQMLYHIDQLKQALSSYLSLIHCIQAGFIGVWGEW